jgi:hypothetical protein
MPRPLKLVKPLRKRRVRLSDLLGSDTVKLIIAEQEEALAEARLAQPSPWRQRRRRN